MDSYVKLKKRLEEIANQTTNMQQEKNLELNNIYEFYNNNTEIFQGYRIPNQEDLSLENKDKITIILNILENFINMSTIPEENKEEVLKSIIKFREIISKQEEALKQLNEEKEQIEKLAEERKNYILNGINKVNNYDKEISIITKEIEELKTNSELSDSMRSQKISKKSDEIKEIRKKMLILKEQFKNDEYFIEDATLLAKEMQLIKEEKDPKVLQDKQENTHPYKKASDLGVETGLIGKWVVKQSDGTYLEIDKSIEKEPAILVLPDNAIINEEKNTYTIPDNTPNEFIPTGPDFNDEVLEEELKIKESYRNLILEQKVKIKKKLKSMLGILSIASKITTMIADKRLSADIEQTLIVVDKLLEDNSELIEPDDYKGIEKYKEILTKTLQEYNEKKDKLSLAEKQEYLEELEDQKENLKTFTGYVYRKIELTQESKGRAR